MAGRFQYNPATNRWEAPTSVQGTDNPPPGFNPVPGATYVDTVTGQKKMFVGQGSPDRVVSGSPTTTTAPKPKAPTTTTPKSPTTTAPKSPTTTAPKAPTTTAPKATTTTSVAPKGTTKKTNMSPTSAVPSKPTTQPTQPAQPSQPTTPVTPAPGVDIDAAVAKALASGDYELAKLILTAQSSGGSGGSSGPTTAQKVTAAKRAGKQNLAMAKKFYGAQQQQANTAIDAATQELLRNMQAPTAYSNVPLVTVPPALQGLQQNLLAYGGTGSMAAGQQAQDQQAADMYTALASRGATQMGAAENAYFEALKRAALQAQTQGKQNVATNVADLQNQVILQNLQAILNAQQ